MPRNSKANTGPGPGSSSKQQGQATWSRRNNAPVLLLSINGTSADDLLRMCVSFTYKRHLGKSAVAEWVFRNDARNLCDDPRLFPNTQWLFMFGYLNDISTQLNGYIREVAPIYAEKKTVKVTCYDALLTMSTKSSCKNWGVVPTSTIAQALAAKHGMQCMADNSNDTPVKAWIQPNDMNDIRFLRDLAALIDFEVFVFGTPPTLYYRKKPYQNPPKAMLTYYDDPSQYAYVKKFAPKVKSLGPVTAGVSNTNSETGMGQKTTSSDPTPVNVGPSVYIPFGDTGVNTNMVVVQPGSAGPPDVTLPAPHMTDSSQLVQTWRQQMLDRAVQADSEHPLTPGIMPGDLFTWAGLEKQLNGLWYCLEHHSEINGSGSHTKIQWKRNTTGQGVAKAADRNNITAPSAPPVVQQVYANTGISGQSVVPASVPRQ